MSKVGIVFDAEHGFGLLASTREKAYYAPFHPTISGIVRAAYLAGLDSMWILPGTEFSALGKSMESQLSLWQDMEGFSMKDHKRRSGEITCIHAYQKGRDTVKIFFPEHDPRWLLTNIDNPRRLLAIVSRLENVLGADLDWSPSYTGKYLMQSLNTGQRASWLAPCTLGEMPVAGNLPVNALKKCAPDLTQIGPGPYYVHWYDQNFAFGASITGLNFGEGSPTHYMSYPWSERLPGLWKLPDGTWRWTPEVEWLLASEPQKLLPHDLGECWIWTTYHQTLRKWAELFWSADRALIDDPHVRAIAKEIRNSAMGLLARERMRDEGQEVDTLARPDMWGLIVSKTRARVEFTKRRLASEGYHCVWTKTDCLGFVSNNPDWRSAVPIARRKNVVTGEIIDATDKLGGYKHAYTLPYDDELVHAFSDACSWKEADKILLNKVRLQAIQRAPTTLVEVAHVD
jgi:hypothetical protein